MERLTENEAIERLQCMRLFMEINDKQNDSKFLEDDYIANEMAIKALEEIQQYRELGTVEHIKLTFELCKGLDAMVKMYQAIGTIEEFKALKEKEERFDRNIKMFNEIGLEVRNNAIDETCLKIFNHLLSEIEWNRVLVDDWDALAEEFKEIAEQMKAGGIDG